MSTVSLDSIPYEILSSIVSYSAEDPETLHSLMKTSRLLHHHAETRLYRTIDLSFASIDLTFRFLESIKLHPRIGSLVASFHLHHIKYHSPSQRPKQYVDLFLSAAKFMPNLKCLTLVQDYHEVPKALRLDPPGTHPPFQLTRLGIRLEWDHWASFRDAWDPQRFKRELLQLLQHQKALRHFSLVLEMDGEIGGQVVPSLLPEESVGEWQEACSSLEILEGTNSAIRLVLPNTQKVKALFWQCDRADDNSEPFRLPNDLETDPVLEDFFTSGHCEAYGRLENLAISRQIFLLSILSTYLSSLKTLLLIFPESTLDREESTIEQEELLLQAIGGLTRLITLVIMHKRDLRLDYKRIFTACGSLQRLALWRRRDGKLSISMERSADGSIRPIEWKFGDSEVPLIPYIWTRWFTFESEDLI